MQAMARESTYPVTRHPSKITNGPSWRRNEPERIEKPKDLQTTKHGFLSGCGRIVEKMGIEDYKGRK
jgi:hypothetical protein